MAKESFSTPRFIKVKPKLDFNNLISGVFKLAVAFYADPIGSPVSGISDLIKSIKPKDAESAGAKAYKLLLLSLESASKNVLEDFERNDNFREHFSKPEIATIQENEASEEDFTFDERFLTCPAEHSLVAQFINYLKAELEIKKASKKLLMGFEEKFKSYYIEAFNKEFSASYGEYSQLENRSSNKTTDAYIREREWREYQSLLSKEVYKPIFDEVFGLRQIYVPLNAHYEIEEKNNEPKTVICRIESQLNDWIDSQDKDDCLRIITGDPGAGKSTVAKVWASKLAEARKRVIFISLNQVRKSTQPEEVIAEYINSKSHRFTHNPYELLGKKETTPLLIIFDGLDEWVAEGKKSVESAKVFIQEIFSILRDTNANQLLMKVLLLSRPIAIQENLKWFKQKCRIYHLLPLYVQKEFNEKTTQNFDLLKEDKRQAWKALYTKFKDLSFQSALLFRERGEISEISAQPLLIYLLTIALNAREGEIDETAININSIYAIILEHVYQRKYGGGTHKHAAALKEDEYYQIMENIACSAWRRGDERTTTHGAIVQQFAGQPARVKKIWKSYLEEDNKNRGVESLLSSFYFQKKESTADDALYEFSHKSFGEYLMAKYVIRVVEKLIDKYTGDSDDADDANVILKTWYERFLGNSFENYLTPYIQRELELIKEENPEKVVEWQKNLTAWMNYLQENNFKHSHGEKSFKEIMFEWACMEQTLVCVLNLCARVNKQVWIIDDWLKNTNFNLWFNRFDNQNYDFEKRIRVASYLSYANLDNANLRHANLSLAHLRSAHLRLANLNHANLNHANLSHANLSHANLSGANLRLASLSLANLSGANLSLASLSLANLIRADLSRANLSHANLSHANLIDANLSGADLSHADFLNSNGLTINQLSKARTLYNCRNLPKDLFDALQAPEYKHLWKNPDEDDE